MGQKSHSHGGEGSKKFIVIGAAQRGGKVIARVIENTKTETFESFVREMVSTDVSLLNTDEHSGYRRLQRTTLSARSTPTPSKASGA